MTKQELVNFSQNNWIFFDEIHRSVSSLLADVTSLRGMYDSILLEGSCSEDDDKYMGWAMRFLDNILNNREKEFFFIKWKLLAHKIEEMEQSQKNIKKEIKDWQERQEMLHNNEGKSGGKHQEKNET